MRHRIGARGCGNFNQAFGNQRARNGRAQQIQPLIQRIGAKHRKHEIAYEFLAQILDKNIFRSDPQKLGLFARRIQLFTLPQISRERHHFAAIFGLQPFQNDRGIEATGIGQYNFFGRTHSIVLCGFDRGDIGF